MHDFIILLSTEYSSVNAIFCSIVNELGILLSTENSIVNELLSNEDSTVNEFGILLSFENNTMQVYVYLLSNENIIFFHFIFWLSIEDSIVDKPIVLSHFEVCYLAKYIKEDSSNSSIRLTYVM